MPHWRYTDNHLSHTLAFVQFPPVPASVENCLFPVQVEQPQMAGPVWDSTAQLPLNYLQNFFQQDQPTCPSGLTLEGKALLYKTLKSVCN